MNTTHHFLIAAAALLGGAGAAQGDSLVESFQGPLDSQLWRTWSTDSGATSCDVSGGRLQMALGQRSFDGWLATSGIYSNEWTIDTNYDARMRLDWFVSNAHGNHDIGGVLGFSTSGPPNAEGLVDEGLLFFAENWMGEMAFEVADLDDGELEFHDFPQIITSNSGTLYLEYESSTDTLTWSPAGYGQEPKNVFVGVTDYQHEPATVIVAAFNVFSDHTFAAGSIWVDNLVIEDAVLIGLDDDDADDGNDSGGDDGQSSPPRPATIVWRHDGDGRNAIWLMDGVDFLGADFLPSVTDSRWQIAATGDLDDNGSADIIWRHLVTGETCVWLMDGTERLFANVLPHMASGWEIAGASDIDGDLRGDLLWRHSVDGRTQLWLLDGSVVREDLELQVISPSWEVAGVVDFNRDSRADIFWFEPATGRTAVWLMDGANLLGGEFGPVMDVRFALAGVADFDGDGTGDLLWRHRDNGSNAMWLMDGMQVRESREILKVGDMQWSIAGAADFNGDGRGDVLWRNELDGRNAIWLMDGFEYVDQQFITTVSESGWAISATLN